MRSLDDTRRFSAPAETSRKFQRRCHPAHYVPPTPVNPYNTVMRITCHVHPKAARPRVEWDGTVARVWVAAPAAEGQANRATVAAVGEWLKVAPARVRIITGMRSRTKILEVDGIDRLSGGRGP
jgi:uncharacterized protein YggU (UPF0235/DUF167 family)